CDARVVSRPDSRRERHLVTEDGKLIRVERGRAPSGPPTFAVVDALVHVRADGPNAGVLRIPIDTRAAAGRIAESLRLARWDDAGGRFYVLPGSSVLSDQGFVIGRVSRPGTYGVAGLPNDDRILTAV